MLGGTRVVLRPYEREDVPRQHALMANLDLVLPAYAAWDPMPLAAREKQFDQRPPERERGEFAIEIEGRFVGFINLHPWSLNHRSGSASFGMAILDPDYVGKGYGREALGLFLDWCFRIQNFRRIGLITWSTNERAIRCYRACGFAEEAREREAQYTDGRYVDVVRMGLLRDEWEAARAR
jgi:RimJ/RimL family protein N-acetyltransferase